MSLTIYLFGPSLSAPLACSLLRWLQQFTYVGLIAKPTPPDHMMLVVNTLASQLRCVSKYGRLSQQLHTQELLLTHVLIGYNQRNDWFYLHLLNEMSKTIT